MNPRSPLKILITMAVVISGLTFFVRAEELTITEVRDIDVIKTTDGRVLELTGLAPRYKIQPGRPDWKFVQSLDLAGKKMVIETDKKVKNSLNRTLAYAFVEYSSPEELSKKEIPENYYLETKINDAGQPWVYLFLNATLLKSGYATLNLAEKDNIKYNALFQSLIEDAKVAQRGFFSQIYLDQIRGASQQSDDDSEPIDP